MIGKQAAVNALWALGVLSSLLVGTDSAKVKRVKAGMTYHPHDAVSIVVNKVGPFNNPTETYRYYSLPFCHEHSTEEEEMEALQEENVDLPDNIPSEKRLGAQKHRQRLGESIVGDRRETSPYEISFGDSVEWRLLCKKLLRPQDIEKFKEAIHNNYFFEMFVEDLPMWGYIGDIAGEDMIIGETEGSGTYLFTHLHFLLGYNNNQIVAAKVTTDIDRKVDITDIHNEKHIQFSYSVEWYEEPNLTWKNRMSRYAESRFLPSSFEIHWLSIINSFVLVLLLTAFLTIILLRVLKNDFSRYMELDDDAMEEEESGWKLIHGDVFRFPQYPAIFCSAVGIGNQLIVLTFFHLCLALTGLISTTRRGSILAGVVVLYCLTSVVAGYTAIRLFRQMGGKNWVQCVILTAGMFPAPIVAVFLWVNSVAIAHGSTSALPFTSILTITALYIFLAFPLTVFGGILAKNYASPDFNAPTRTTKVAREIPTEVPWYRSRPFQVLIAGFLPFSAIYIELHYIFASMWGHQIYTLFGILLLAFILLIIVTSFITVALLYFQLAREDHRWWWAAFINGGMTGIFIYIYSFYYYFHRSGMSGVLQSSFYFGYMAVVSFAFFLMLGSAGFQFSLIFVKYIYSRVKCD
ncbi:endomembrane protein 70-domain containing protein [Nitzschia inconspicua]|uniref:Transmembrane 9 superfamily member n=1 Tax=Nitzschia inconspicua TaxID=303405 RepID=A0A9K3KMD7_9STRA|nr:endomembrane protein 70-domain containing protein [Nitzschia inconspicua]KAG7346081.1 endomembrane protein 70-domain containing protein [Nitzschia inconspicua]